MFNLLQIKFCTSDFFLFNSLIIHFCLNILNPTLSDHLKLILTLCAEASHCDHMTPQVSVMFCTCVTACT